MRAAGITSPVLLEELESHLREEVERQMRAGLDAPSAFAIGVGQIGQAKTLQTEFTKIERNDMKRMTYILLGIFGVLLGMALVLPAMAYFRDRHVLHGEQLMPLLIGLLIVGAGMGSAIYGLKKRSA